jgi:hypothetical protein
MYNVANPTFADSEDVKNSIYGNMQEWYTKRAEREAKREAEELERRDLAAKGKAISDTMTNADIAAKSTAENQAYGVIDTLNLDEQAKTDRKLKAKEAVDKHGTVFIDPATGEAYQNQFIYTSTRKSKVAKKIKDENEKRVKDNEIAIQKETKKQADLAVQQLKAAGIDQTDAEKIVSGIADENEQIEINKRLDVLREKNKSGIDNALSKAQKVFIDNANRNNASSVYSKEMQTLTGADIEDATYQLEEAMGQSDLSSFGIDTLRGQLDALKKGYAEYVKLDPTGKIANNPLLSRIKTVEDEINKRDEREGKRKEKREASAFSSVNAARRAYSDAARLYRSKEYEMAKLRNDYAIAKANNAGKAAVANIEGRYKVLIAEMNNANRELIAARDNVARIDSTAGALALINPEAATALASRKALNPATYGTQQQQKIARGLTAGPVAAVIGYTPPNLEIIGDPTITTTPSRWPWGTPNTEVGRGKDSSVAGSGQGTKAKGEKKTKLTAKQRRDREAGGLLQ